MGPLEMNVGWNIVAGTATRYLLPAANVCLGIFLMAYTVRRLGISEYGFWSISGVVFEGAVVGAAYMIAVWL